MTAKILYLVHPEMDHLEAMTFSGLTMLLGEENVITYPFKKSYYGIGDDSYILDDGKRGFTSPYENIVPRNGKQYNIDDIKDMWDQFTHVVMGTMRTYGIRAMRELVANVGDKWWQPFIMVDGEDSTRVRWELVREFRPSVYFQREYEKEKQIQYPQNLGYWPPIIPCPFSAMPENLPQSGEKELNVYAVFGNTHSMRVRAIKRLMEMKISKSNLWLDNFLMNINLGSRNNLAGHLKNILKSRIAISVRGHGMDTVRYWEIPMFNTLLFTHDTGQQIPNPFEDGKNCVMFKNDFSDFEQKLWYYLDDENECQKVAKAGREHLYKYHTAEKRAQYILDNIKQ